MLFFVDLEEDKKTGEDNYKEANKQTTVEVEDVPAIPPLEEDISREEEDSSEIELKSSLGK